MNKKNRQTSEHILSTHQELCTQKLCNQATTESNAAVLPKQMKWLHDNSIKEQLSAAIRILYRTN